VVLPDLNGVELAEKLLSRQPGLSVLLASSYVDDKSHWDIIGERGFKFLQKPYSLTELLSVVKSLMEKGKKDG